MSRDSDRALIMWQTEVSLIPRVKTSIWLWIAIGILTISNILFLVSFVTHFWGEINYQTDTGENKRLVYGLWVMCRYPDDVCSSIGVPIFYGASRAFAVLALFGHVLSLALLIGHVLEKLLEYDPCTLGLFTAINFSTSVFLLISVSVFAGEFPRGFSDVVVNGSRGFGYSFVLAGIATPLPIFAGIMCILEIRASLMRMARKLEGKLDTVETYHQREEY